jgi:DNA-binding beta-propeller fold protein YncE
MTRTSILGGGGVTLASDRSLNDPLGLAVAPNGDIVTANGADGKLVETSPAGHEVASKTLVADGAGDLFGLAVAPRADGIYFVNDAGSGPAANSLQLLH